MKSAHPAAICRPRSLYSLCRTLALALAIAAPGSALAADVVSYVVLKGSSYTQTSSAAPTLAPGEEYGANVHVWLNPAGAGTAASVGPQGNPAQSLDLKETGHLMFSTEFSTKAQLDSNIPNGTYTMRMQTVHDGTISGNLAVTPDSYPNAPQITNYDLAQAIDPSAAFTLNWNTFSGGSSADLVYLEIRPSPGGTASPTVFLAPLPGQPGALTGTAVSTTIPAGTLSANTTYVGLLVFVKVTNKNTTAYSGAPGYGGFSAGTKFTLSTTDGIVPPGWTTQPSNKTVAAGGTTTFTAAASGSPVPTLKWQVSSDSGSNWSDVPNSGPYSGATTGTLTISGATLAMNGYQYRCFATNDIHNYTLSNSATLTVNKASATVALGGLSTTYNGLPQSATATTSPSGLSVTFTYNGSATAPTSAGSYAVVGTINDASYQGSASGTLVIAKASLTAIADDKTRVEGTANPPLTISYTGFVNGETKSVLTSEPTASTTATTAHFAGTYLITLSGGSAANYSLTLQSGVLTITPQPPGAAGRLINLSALANAGSGGSTLTVGFTISGTGVKHVVIRGVGPKLADFNVPVFVADPLIRLYKIDGTLLAENDDWVSMTAANAGGFSLPAGSKDAALDEMLAPGGYTVQLINSGQTARALIELYDIGGDDTAKLTNLSCRLNLSAGEIVVFGTALSGGSRPILVRNSGPGLAPYLLPADQSLVAPDPYLRFYDSSGVLIGQNDNWDPSLAARFDTAGAFPLADGSKDASDRLLVQPGLFTAHASAVGPGGIILIELYDSP